MVRDDRLLHLQLRGTVQSTVRFPITRALAQFSYVHMHTIGKRTLVQFSYVHMHFLFGKKKWYACTDHFSYVEVRKAILNINKTFRLLNELDSIFASGKFRLVHVN